MDLLSFIKMLMAEGYLGRMGRTLGFSFGTPNRQYLGATLMPERIVPNNLYTEDDVRYRTVVANAATRYSPVQIKEGSFLSGSMKVELGESDIGSELKSNDYDALIDYLNRTGTQQAEALALGWVNTALNLGLIEFNEMQRWQAIVDGQCVRRGDNNYEELVEYPNPAGHRVTAASQWSVDANDPLDDIMAGVDLLKSKGFTPNRIIAPNAVRSLLTKNEQIRNRLGVTVINAGGTLDRRAARANLSALNNIFASEELPAIEPYDLQYFDQEGAKYFLPRGVMVIACTTGRDEESLVNPLNVDEVRLVTDTLGYVGVGRAAGQQTSGRAFDLQPRTKKPPAVEGEAWQTSLPVVTEPEAFFVITGIS